MCRMERLAVKLLVLIVFFALVGPRVRLAAAAQYIEDHYDIPGVHDCWGFRPHFSECGR
jgi:hypothetical protein